MPRVALGILIYASAAKKKQRGKKRSDECIWIVFCTYAKRHYYVIQELNTSRATRHVIYDGLIVDGRPIFPIAAIAIGSNVDFPSEGSVIGRSSPAPDESLFNFALNVRVARLCAVGNSLSLVVKTRYGNIFDEVA